MSSYPASCDYMVSRPPTYEESMRHYYNTKYKTNSKQYRIHNIPHNTQYRPHNTQYRPHNGIYSPEINRPIINRNTNYTRRRKHICNIL